MENVEHTEEEVTKLAELKKILLEQYKALEEPLKYAQNDFEVGIIKEQRAELVDKIKEIAATLNTYNV
jgi:predicted  nucleic acid-binding Zn-ribbon protein